MPMHGVVRNHRSYTAWYTRMSPCKVTSELSNIMKGCDTSVRLLLHIAKGMNIAHNDSVIVL